jgi:L-alanine-DL-glutamate epimerase-like enolase superfamily enzyme
MDARIDRLSVTAYRVPTDAQESDGTLEWDATTMILVEASGGGRTGLGYTYSHTAAARLVSDTLADCVTGRDPLAVTAVTAACRRRVRNLGQSGMAAAAVSAVDVALWDLKARLLELPLVRLLGQVRPAVEVYGSGGFTSYSVEQLREQLGRWIEAGMRRVKMKVGRRPEHDVRRVEAARAAIGPDAELFVDANGAYDRKQALRMAREFAESDVSWFEEPVSSDDLEGLRLLRDRAPADMEIAAGEYGFEPFAFRRMLEAGAVDVLQPDGTRCGGVTGFLAADALCQAHCVPLSAHTAPSLHAHTCAAAVQARHLEFFHDHVRIERLFFDGFLEPVDGRIAPDPVRSGLGLELKRADAERFAVWRHEGT